VTFCSIVRRSTFGAKNLLPEEHETQDVLPKDYSRFLFWLILAYFEASVMGESDFGPNDMKDWPPLAYPGPHCSNHHGRNRL
jgi:hypothetical protein